MVKLLNYRSICVQQNLRYYDSLFVFKLLYIEYLLSMRNLLLLKRKFDFFKIIYFTNYNNLSFISFVDF